jgi:molecular chaperone GrpE
MTNNEQVWEEAVGDEFAGSESQVSAEQTLSLEERLAEVEAEAARNLDGWQRTQAEFANARKRFEKQRVETTVNAHIELVGKLLPLIDDFERALDSVPDDQQGTPWVAGVALVYRKMLSVLDELNVEPIPAVGEAFDPNLHEALSQEPSDEYDSGIIGREMRRGYRLGDRVIRPSLVTVVP